MAHCSRSATRRSRCRTTPPRSAGVAGAARRHDGAKRLVAARSVTAARSADRSATRVLLRDHLERRSSRHRREPGESPSSSSTRRFKRVNDSLGPRPVRALGPGGGAPRPCDPRGRGIVAPLRGDEFAVLLVTVVEDEADGARGRSSPPGIACRSSSAGGTVVHGQSSGIAVAAVRRRLRACRVRAVSTDAGGPRPWRSWARARILRLADAGPPAG